MQCWHINQGLPKGLSKLVKNPFYQSNIKHSKLKAKNTPAWSSVFAVAVPLQSQPTFPSSLQQLSSIRVLGIELLALCSWDRTACSLFLG